MVEFIYQPKSGSRVFVKNIHLGMQVQVAGQSALGVEWGNHPKVDPQLGYGNPQGGYGFGYSNPQGGGCDIPSVPFYAAQIVVKWRNGCHHVFGGFKLSYGCASPGQYWRGWARRMASVIVERVGGIGWDEQGTVNLIVPVGCALKAHSLMRGVQVANGVRVERDVNGVRLLLAGYNPGNGGWGASSGSGGGWGGGGESKLLDFDPACWDGSVMCPSGVWVTREERWEERWDTRKRNGYPQDGSGYGSGSKEGCRGGSGGNSGEGVVWKNVVRVGWVGRNNSQDSGNRVVDHNRDIYSWAGGEWAAFAASEQTTPGDWLVESVEPQGALMASAAPSSEGGVIA